MASQITSNIEAYEYRQPNNTYKLGKYSVAGKITDLDSVSQSIKHILNTERFSNPIYSDSYGVEFEQYVGKDLAYILASVENTIREALLQDDRITDVLVTDVNQTDIDKVMIYFTVYTIYGNLNDTYTVMM